MDQQPLAARLHRLPVVTALGREVRVARGFRARLLGLAFLDRVEAGAGLLIPRCASVHTVGMRFRLDLTFLDCDGTVLEIQRGVRPFHVVSCPRAATVLELPSAPGDFRPGLSGSVADLVRQAGQGADSGLQRRGKP